MNKCTMAEEDYLEAIYLLESKQGKVRSVAVSNLLKVSKPAVNMATNSLAEKGLITKERYGNIALTPDGKAIAEEVYGKHTTIRKLLLHIGVSQDAAERDCCRIEHAVSGETAKKLEELCQRLHI